MKGTTAYLFASTSPKQNISENRPKILTARILKCVLSVVVVGLRIGVAVLSSHIARSIHPPLSLLFAHGIHTVLPKVMRTSSVKANTSSLAVLAADMT